MYIRMYVCICIYIYTCIYVYMYIYDHIVRSNVNYHAIYSCVLVPQYVGLYF